MKPFHQSMNEYKELLKKGDIQAAYQGLMQYFRDLRTHFKDKYPEFSVTGSIYYGYMDMTYFSLFPEVLKQRKLKIAIVFVYDTFGFEVWLSGSNRNVQIEYWNMLKESGWNKYNFASNPKREDYVIGHILINDPDFSDLDSLTEHIESGTLAFIQDVEDLLSKQ